jgi:malate/lactate dehydrogenase
MTRLDQNRAVAQLAKRLSVSPAEIRNVVIWGNHSSTQYPDVSHASVFDKRLGAYVKIEEAIAAAGSGLDYLRGDFISSVQKRGAAIIDVLGKSSAASAANAAVEHVRDWFLGTKEGEFVSMGVVSDGSYGVTKGLVYSFPVRCKAGGEYEIVQGLEVSEFSREKFKVTEKELEEEKADATAGTK